MKDLSLNSWKNIIDELIASGVTVIAIEGGEPTLYDNLHDIVEYIKDRGVYCIIITNGTRDINGLLPDVFWVSIDAMAQTHDSIRGRGTFAKVVNTLAANTDKKLITLTSISKENERDIEALCNFLHDKVYGLMFNFIYPYSNIKHNTLNNEERQEVGKRLLLLKKKYPQKVLNSYSFLKGIGSDKGHLYPWLLTTVTSDGKKIQGCLVRHVETEDCSLCDMGCCIELSNLYKLNDGAIAFWAKNIGLPKLISISSEKML